MARTLKRLAELLEKGNGASDWPIWGNSHLRTQISQPRKGVSAVTEISALRSCGVWTWLGRIFDGLPLFQRGG